MEYKVKAVKEGFKEWSNDYGAFRTYLVQVEGNGEPVSINRKADSPVPKVGEDLYGDITQGKFGQSFKSKKKPFTPNNYESPERQDSINRAVALNNAVNLYAGTKTLPVIVLLTADAFLGWLKQETNDEKPAVEAGSIPHDEDAYEYETESQASERMFRSQMDDDGQS